MGAEVTQHNKLLQQLSSSFPGNYSGSSVYVYDFGAAFSKVCLRYELQTPLPFEDIAGRLLSPMVLVPMLHHDHPLWSAYKIACDAQPYNKAVLSMKTDTQRRACCAGTEQRHSGLHKHQAGVLPDSA